MGIVMNMLLRKIPTNWLRCGLGRLIDSIVSIVRLIHRLIWIPGIVSIQHIIIIATIIIIRPVIIWLVYSILLVVLIISVVIKWIVPAKMIASSRKDVISIRC